MLETKPTTMPELLQAISRAKPSKIWVRDITSRSEVAEVQKQVNQLFAASQGISIIILKK